MKQRDLENLTEGEINAHLESVSQTLASTPSDLKIRGALELAHDVLSRELNKKKLFSGRGLHSLDMGIEC